MQILEVGKDTTYREFLKELKSQKKLAADTETTSSDWIVAELLCISFSWNEHAAFVLPVGCYDYYNCDDGKDLPVKKVCRDLNEVLKDKRVAFHNAHFDIHIFKSNGVIINKWDDTLLMGGLLEPHRRRGLEIMSVDVGMILGTHNAAANEAKKTKSLSAYVEYSGKDALAAWKLRNLYARRLKKEKQWRFYRDTERPLIDAVVVMEENGMPVDKKLLLKIDGKISGKIVKVEKKIFREAGHKFNIASNPQLAEVLFKEMGLPVLKKSSKTGNPSADESVLAELSKDVAIAKYLMRHRGLAKLRNTYTSPDSELHLRSIQNGKMAWVHASINQGAAKTGRFSVKAPPLQTIPADEKASFGLRGVFRAPGGWKIVAVDYNQIEVRLAAHFSGAKILIDAYEKGEDVHQKVADELNVDRRVAKSMQFMMLYGGGAGKLSQVVGIPFEEARSYVERYNNRIPEVTLLRSRVIGEGRTKGYITLLSGRRMKAPPELWSPVDEMRAHAERSLFNALIQGSAKEVMSMGILNCHRNEFLRKHAKMLMTVHDELIFLCREKFAEKVLEETRSCMEDIPWKTRVPILASGGIGDSWLTAKG